jgi:hypothetical protein
MICPNDTGLTEAMLPQDGDGLQVVFCPILFLGGGPHTHILDTDSMKLSEKSGKGWRGHS